jgi:non-specific serine/threonine protein kinase
MVTLTGIGGSGKTRLAQAIARKTLAEFRDGVWFVDLAPLSEASLIGSTIASAMQLPESPGRDALDELSDYLAGRQTLLVLDNCEHLIEASSSIADRLLGAARSLTILATSREGLGLEGESIVAVKPLALPPASGSDPSQLSAIESVRLFLDRAAVASPGFALTQSNAQAISEICTRLDGIPLAIELAAARTKVLAVEQIRARLDDRFRLL